MFCPQKYMSLRKEGARGRGRWREGGAEGKMEGGSDVEEEKQFHAIKKQGRRRKRGDMNVGVGLLFCSLSPSITDHSGSPWTVSGGNCKQIRITSLQVCPQLFLSNTSLRLSLCGIG